MSSGRSDGLLDAEERGRALKAAGIVGVAMRGLGGNESSSSISNACTSVSTMWDGRNITADGVGSGLLTLLVWELVDTP
jgi:hypothetical protein